MTLKLKLLACLASFALTACGGGDDTAHTEESDPYAQAGRYDPYAAGDMQPPSAAPYTGAPGGQQPYGPPPTGMGQQPGMQQPGFQQPNMSGPGMEQPNMGQPFQGQPGAQQPGMSGQPNMGQPGMGGPGAMPSGGGLASLQAPQGMMRIPSQAGNVFGTRLDGSGAMQQAQRIQQGLRGYFEADLNVMGQQADPSGMYAQIGFSSMKNGQPVMGMIVVSPGAPGEMNGALLLDTADRFQGSSQAMMQALMGG